MAWFGFARKAHRNSSNLKAKHPFSNLFNFFISFSYNFLQKFFEMLVGCCTFLRFIGGIEMELAATDLPSARSTPESNSLTGKVN